MHHIYHVIFVQNLNFSFAAHTFRNGDCDAVIPSNGNQPTLVTSVAAFTSGCAKANTPLRIRVGDGQRMNVSMYNFEFSDDVRHGGEVKVFDPTSQESKEGSGVARMEFLMMSLSSEVEVTFQDDTSNIALQITGTMEKK